MKVRMIVLCICLLGGTALLARNQRVGLIPPREALRRCPISSGRGSAATLPT